MTTTEQVKEWCRQQCIIQHATTEADFARMEGAWKYAYTAYNSSMPLDVDSIRRMAILIDPDANPGGQFRKGPAVFMGGGSAANAEDIPVFLQSLLNVLSDERFELTPTEFYNELVYIHPFQDGNGRVGALVYNMLNGTILNPIDPPEYK